VLGPETLNLVRPSTPVDTALVGIRSVAVDGMNQFVRHNEKRSSAAYM